MYNEIVYRLLDFVEINFDKHISITELENTAHYSYRNLQRIFKYATGETIGAFQKRLKLEKAYKLLLYSQKSISEIAMEVNFESLSAFSKSFKQNFSISPKEAKLKKIELLKQNFGEPNSKEIALKPEIIFLPAVKIFYKSTWTDYCSEDIEALWTQFTNYIFPQDEADYYGVVADEPLITEKLKCRYSAGCNKQALNVELPTQNILGKRYAKFIHHGRYSSIEETYRNIYTNWIFDNSIEFDSSPIVEHYIKHAENTANDNDFITAILIPLLK